MSKTIKQLVGDNSICELNTKTIIRVKGDTVHLETWLMDGKDYVQRICWMKDQPLAVLKRKQISTQ